ncbi:MAG: rRNA pseudouridine synthase [Oscillospiraceae bacterium]|nr:rRNA pseudouridine synthase [Oscillospiraceae bacterium]
MRLDKFLSDQTTYSRREICDMIRHGKATVNGVAVLKNDIRISEERDSITLLGKAVVYQKYHWYLMHKPKGVITAANDKKQITVLDLLSPEERFPGVSPCGRLDKDSSGLLLLTDDGQTAHKLISPRHHAPKYYLVKLRDPFKDEYRSLFQSGMMLREGDREEACLPASCEAIEAHLAVVELHEGKYHQVRRMFAAAGNHVDELLRVQIGQLSLPPELPAGGYFNIINKDIDSALKSSDISYVCEFCQCNYSSYWII